MLAIVLEFATGMPLARAVDVHPICAQFPPNEKGEPEPFCDLWQTSDDAGKARPVRNEAKIIDWLPPGWGSDIVLLGEVHDNPSHHAIRGGLAVQLSGMRRIGGSLPSTALVFEHIRADQQPALDQFAEFNAKARRLGTAGDLFRLLDWDKSGWPDQKIFEPLFSAAIAGKLPILPGDPPRERVRAIAKGGDAALTDDERQRFKLDQPLDAKLQDALLGELEASHCGLMPKSAFGNMAVAQRYRDAHLADALAKAADKHGAAILLAGNGHVRKDRGVPSYLSRMAPDRKVVSVMLLEVEDGRNEPEAYIPRDPDGKPAVDYVLFTPRAERKDPCAEMRERFGKHK